MTVHMLLVEDMPEQMNVEFHLPSL